jgi:HD-GYP domain-containing protein (c-di-GMP phosphodiesterase class II)
MKQLPIRVRLFLFTIYIFTIVSLAVLIAKQPISNLNANIIEIVFFGVLFAVSESSVVVYKSMAISTSLAIQIAALILFQPIPAIVIIILGFTFRVIKHNNSLFHILNTPIYKTLFNYCVIIIPMIYGSIIYKSIGGSFGIYTFWAMIPTVALFSSIYFLINTSISSMLFALLSNKNVLYYIINNGRVNFLSSIIMTPFGVALAYLFAKFGYGGVMLIILPIVLVRYTFYLYIEYKTQYVETVDTLMHAMEARDKYTQGHSQRVAEISTLIAKELRYGDMKIERLHMASLLHDVGKIGIDDSILNKPGKLTYEEYEAIKTHPQIGYDILKDIKNLQDILPIVRNHHERYDGKGYPDGKKLKELDLDVFIVQLADTIDAMTTDRPYRKAMSEEEVISEITKYSGTQFHPKVVQAYLNILEKQKKAV